MRSECVRGRARFRSRVKKERRVSVLRKHKTKEFSMKFTIICNCGKRHRIDTSKCKEYICSCGTKVYERI